MNLRENLALLGITAWSSGVAAVGTGMWLFVDAVVSIPGIPSALSGLWLMAAGSHAGTVAYKMEPGDWTTDGD